MVRIGVVGHGNRMSNLIKLWHNLDPDVRVVAIIDPDVEGARSRLDDCDRRDVKFYRTLPEMVGSAKLNALTIGTRCNLHTPYAIKAASYDIPLYLEKPVATSMRQAVALERAFEKAKCDVLVSFPLRVSPLCVLAKKRIDEGRLGHPEHILGVNFVPYGTTYWDCNCRQYDITQGLFLQKATHDFDYMCFLMGSNIVRVAAMFTRGRIFGGTKPTGLVCSQCDESETCLESPESRMRNQSGGRGDDHPCLFGVDCGSPETGINEDSSSAVVEFASGVHGIYTQVFYTRRDAATRGATVSGYHGTLSFDWYTNNLKLVRHHESATTVEQPGEGKAHFGGDNELSLNFLNMVKGTEKSQATIWAGIQSVYTCLAAKKSAETGRFVNVRQVGSQSFNEHACRSS